MINKKVYCNGKVIANKIVYCDNLLRMATGLMLRSKHSVEDTAWWFRFRKPRRVAVTMFLVFFPIDVVFLDANNKIIEIKQDLKPFRNYNCENKISSFLELECGIVKKKSLKVGMKLSLNR
jgi:uncharacterized membrane protein (UPF0127 family)